MALRLSPVTSFQTSRSIFLESFAAFPSSTDELPTRLCLKFPLRASCTSAGYTLIRDHGELCHRLSGGWPQIRAKPNIVQLALSKGGDFCVTHVASVTCGTFLRHVTVRYCWLNVKIKCMCAWNGVTSIFLQFKFCDTWKKSNFPLLALRSSLTNSTGPFKINRHSVIDFVVKTQVWIYLLI